MQDQNQPIRLTLPDNLKTKWLITAQFNDEDEQRLFIADCIDHAVSNFDCNRVFVEAYLRTELALGRFEVKDYIDALRKSGGVIVYVDYGIDPVTKILLESISTAGIKIYYTYLQDDFEEKDLHSGAIGARYYHQQKVKNTLNGLGAERC